MVNKAIEKFKGFYPETLEFLINLKINDSKSWFEANRSSYEEYVLAPFKSLVAELASLMLEIDPQLEVTPAVDKTISRIYRDIRFSKDKSLYKSSVWITFKRPAQDWKETPCYYFEIMLDGYRYGMGFYNTTKHYMDTLRRKLDEKPGEFLEAAAAYDRKLFAVEGEKYKRMDCSGQPELIADFYSRKSFYIVCNKKIDEQLFRPELAGEIKSGFRTLKPLYDYLWKVRLEEGI